MLSNFFPPAPIHRYADFSLQTLAPAVLALALAGSASAQDATQPPSLVGRIAAVTGDVSMLRAGDQDWTTAEINEPVSIGDAVFAQDDGDARLQIGATDLDLLAGSEFDIAVLDDQTGRLRLDSGSIDIRIAAMPTEEGLLVSTPRGDVQLTQPGIYRIDAGSDDQPTAVSAWTGAAQMGANGPSVAIRQGQTLLINGSVDAPQYSYTTITADYPQEWRKAPRIVASEDHYVSASMTGGEDLYSYGAFQNDANYGAVWYPSSVPADWEPYRYGHWEYVAPWGQTWIDDQPWGFAPFHYGRWARIGERWGWCPGAYDPHPVYAPALVAFVGGGGFSASISFGGEAVGWIPLGPGEIYRPPYHVDQAYVENVNRTLIVNKTVINRTTIINEYNNAPRPVANFANTRFATVTPASAIARGEPVSRSVLKVAPEALGRASVDQQLSTQIRREPAPNRPSARPGPVKPAEVSHGATIPRPALLPPTASHGGAGQPRPHASPAIQMRPEARPAQPPAAQGEERQGRPSAPPTPPSKRLPNAQAPREDAQKPPMAKPEASRPNAEARTPEPPRAPESPRNEHAPAPQDHEAPARQQIRPEPQERPEPAARPQQPDARRERPEPRTPERPEPQAQVRPEARPAESPRPRSEPQAARPEPQTHAAPPPRTDPAREPPRKEPGKKEEGKKEPN